MTFIVTLVALLIERFFDWSHLRHWHWFTTYQRAIAQRLAGKSTYLVLAATVLPLVLGVGLFDYLISDVLYGFIDLWFELFLLLYCFGPQNLWADTFACINALIQGDASYAMEKLKTAFNINNSSNGQSLHRHLLDSIFIESNRRVFAVVFWYVLLGPAGAVLYRTVVLSSPSTEFAKHEVPAELWQGASVSEAVLNWIPVRIFTFIFALGGQFVQVLSCWRKEVLKGLDRNEAMLIECGTAALHYDDHNKIPVDGSAERAAISLLDRAFLIGLALIAIAILVG